MKVSDFNYTLPDELIAQHPISKRDESRLLILDKNSGKIEHKIFKNIVDYLNPGDCLVINNTKVIPARLYGNRVNNVGNETGESRLALTMYNVNCRGSCPQLPGYLWAGAPTIGAKVEVLLLKNLGADRWEAMVRPGKKLMPGAEISFGNGILLAKIVGKAEGGNRILEFKYDGIFNEILDEIGLMPLPPYIKEKLEEKERYQTVYAKVEGSAAAPTAGLHFTNELLGEIKKKGINIANVTLNVGIGTFRPVKVENVEEHHMHSEYFEIDLENAELINKIKKAGGRIIAVGTTSCRVLESAVDENGIVHEMKADTNIFIYGDYKFRMIDALITNFHLPESTLIMLVSALAGKENIMNAYKTAVEEKYRFFSFGDAMLIK